MLYEKLAEQISRLEEEVRPGQLLQPNELELLRLVAVASAYDARLWVRPLVKLLGLAAPKRTFRFFEKEYLIRLSDDGSLVQGLHPIRSIMLSNLLTDSTLTPWTESAQICLPFIYEPDTEVFLLHAFSQRQADIQSLWKALVSYQTNRWVAVAGIMRAFIWLGVREYVDANREVIRKHSPTQGEGGLSSSSAMLPMSCRGEQQRTGRPSPA